MPGAKGVKDARRRRATGRRASRIRPHPSEASRKGRRCQECKTAVSSAIAAADGRRWLDPCKGWPSAPASGGSDLDKGPAIDMSRCQEIEGQEAGLHANPTLNNAAAEKMQNSSLTKSPIRARP